MKTPSALEQALSATMVLLAASAAPMTTSTMADTFGTGADTFTMDFVTIGTPGNAADTTGYGAVSYTYQMGTYEVSRDISIKAGIHPGFPGNPNFGHPDQPASFRWLEAAKFVNWLNTSTGHAAAYNFDGNGNFNLWSAGQAWQQGGENLYRNKDAHYFLPSENEWYKAAYFNGTKYFDYPTGSDSVPTPVAGGTGVGTAVYNQDIHQGPADVFNAGGLSSYGTMAQGGNYREWMESAYDGSNDLPFEDRAVCGGSWDLNEVAMDASFRLLNKPYDGVGTWGFRVAAVPEPEEYAAAFGVALLSAGVWMRRKSTVGTKGQVIRHKMWRWS